MLMMMKGYQRIKFQMAGRGGGHLKRLTPCYKGMGPKLNLFGIKHFQGELSKDSFFYSKESWNASLLQYQQLSGKCAKVC